MYINHQNTGNHEYPSNILFDTSSMYQNIFLHRKQTPKDLSYDLLLFVFRFVYRFFRHGIFILLLF